MGRQRMISDSIWTDPKLAHLSSEDLLTNVMLLSNRDSNVIGVYQTMWRSVGAGLGWTETQMLTKARDLAAKGVIAIDEREGWVWVKNWWDHNALRAAFLGNVAKKARSEFNKVPAHWKDAVYEWLLENDGDRVCEGLLTSFEGAYKGLESPSQGAGGNPTPNLSDSSTTTPTKSSDSDFERLDIESLVEAAVWATSKTGVISNEPGFRHKVMTRIRTCGANPTDLQTLTSWQSAQATSRTRAILLQQSAADSERLASEQAHERDRIAASFESLDQSSQNELIRSLDTHLAATSPTVHKLFQKHGVASPVGRATLFEFMKSSSALSSELTAG